MTNHHPEPDAGASAHEIVDDIERTREELGDTIDALAAKLDVKAQMKSTVDDAKANVKESAGQAAGTAQQRWPEIAVAVVTIVAAVVAWRRLS